nr:hypothetical protein [Tanacetum cinerariifolium]
MKFVYDCKPLVDSAGNIRYPCKSCRLVLWVSIKHISDHISKYGFDLSYKTWIHHGEPDLPSPPPVIDNTRQPQMSDMTACINDLSYIPLNNEENKPTQKDIGEISNDPTQAKRNKFKELYASTNEELYPSCNYVTRLDFMATFTYFKVKGYESIHACVNDCFLFRGDANKDVHFSPVCNTGRLKDSNTPRKKVPKKVLCYNLIISRLQHLYQSSHNTKEMTWHATRKYTRPGKMQHSVEGRAWKNFDTDQSYSMWPMILTTYNLPSWLYEREFFHANPGVETIDVATCQKFDMRAMVLRTINDFPARSSLSRWNAQGCKACPTCNEDTPSQYLPSDIAKPLIELCLFFKQICSQTLMVDDMLNAQSKMYPFERFMKKLKNYVRNKAKPEGSIVEGYVAEEALTFSSHYFQDVNIKFNRPDHNVDCPPPTCQL